MMSIDPHHPVIVETLTSIMDTEMNLLNFHMNIADYDGINYLLFGLSETMMGFSMVNSCTESIGNAGGYEAVEQFYQGFPAEKNNSNCYTLALDCSQLPQAPEARHNAAVEIANKFSLFRTIFLSGPFLSALNAVNRGASFQAKQVDLRSNEKLFIVPGEGRATFVFQIIYKDSNDSSLAKIFLQEFQDAKKQISNAPTVTITSSPPEQISQFRPNNEGMFLTMTVLKAQITNPVDQARWISSLKQYLTYHVHSCKTYLHMRMRKKTDMLYNALRQAVPEKLEEKIFKKVRATKGIKEEARIINNFRE